MVWKVGGEVLSGEAEKWRIPSPPRSSLTTKRRARALFGCVSRWERAAMIWLATLALASTVPRPEMRMSSRLNMEVSEGRASEYGMKGGTVSMWLVRMISGLDDQDG